MRLKELVYEEWIPVPEIVKFLALTRQTVYSKINNLELTTQKEKGILLVKSSDFLSKLCPPELRFELAKKGSTEIAVSHSPNNKLTEKQKRTALLKDALLRSYEIAFEGLGYGEIWGAKEKFIEAYNTGELYPHIFEVIGKRSVKTLEKWLNTWQQSGRDPYSLVPGYNYKDKSDTKLTEPEKQLFLNFLLQPQQIKISKAYQLTKYILETKHNISVTTHEATYRRFANEFKTKQKDVWVLMRLGEKALREKLLPYVERDIELLEVGDVFVADGKVTTFDVQNPFTGKRSKAVFIAYLDWKSMDIAGYELMITENTQAVTSALRHGILRLGRKPKIAYQDNGKSFKNRFFNRADDFHEAGWTGLFGTLGIIAVYAMPYNAKAKVVELRWKEMVEGFEKLLPTFTGTSPVNKPAYMMRNEKFHKQYHAAMYGDYVPTLEEAKDLIEIWLDFYRAQPCPHVKGKTIGEVFNEGKGNGVDESELDELMMNWGDKPIPVKQNGVELLHGRYYDEPLTSLVGEKVWVKYSLFDITKVSIFDEKGRFICRAERREKMHPMAAYLGTAKDVNALKQQLKQKSKLEREIKNKTRQLMEHHERVDFLQIPERKIEKLQENTNSLKLLNNDEPEEEIIYTYYADKEEAENNKAAKVI